MLKRNHTQKVGQFGEDLAVKYLKAEGYEIIERNYRTKLGEIDIIAKDNAVLVFIEVKSRMTNKFGDAKYAITKKKQEKLSKLALYYLKEKKYYQLKSRFDVVAINMKNQQPCVSLIRNAFFLKYG